MTRRVDPLIGFNNGTTSDTQYTDEYLPPHELTNIQGPRPASRSAEVLYVGVPFSYPLRLHYFYSNNSNAEGKEKIL